MGQGPHPPTGLTAGSEREVTARVLLGHSFSGYGRQVSRRTGTPISLSGDQTTTGSKSHVLFGNVSRHGFNDLFQDLARHGADFTH